MTSSPWKNSRSPKDEPKKKAHARSSVKILKIFFRRKETTKKKKEKTGLHKKRKVRAYCIAMPEIKVKAKESSAQKRKHKEDRAKKRQQQPPKKKEEGREKEKRKQVCREEENFAIRENGASSFIYGFFHRAPSFQWIRKSFF